LPKDKNKPYEAVYANLRYNEKSRINKNTESALQFYFIEEDQIPKDSDSPSAFDIEAAFIAKTIYDMVNVHKTKIRERVKDAIILRECRYSDFALLQRTRTHQNSFEKQFKTFGVPYNAETPNGLFYDAPVNDLLNILRLIVYPNDSIAYAAVLRSPFVRLTDTAFLACMFQAGKEPFDKTIQDALPEDERPIYASACDFYDDIKTNASRLSIAELISKLWYDCGYRYETLWSNSSQNFGELFDYFFEIARSCDERNKSLSEFLDYVDGLKNRSIQLENIDIPLERSEGVHFLSIHKSKGLEYPIVFISGCAARPQPLKNAGLVYYNKDFGPCINLPAHDDLQEIDAANYFFNKEKLMRQLMETAELRRLLYVAMTRAETKLFISGILPKLSGEDSKTNDDLASLPLEARLSATFNLLNEKREKKMSSLDFGDEKHIIGYTIPSFLEILFKPLLSQDRNQFFSINTIHLFTRRELQNAKQTDDTTISILESAHNAKPHYEKINLPPEEAPQTFYINASKLHTQEQDLDRKPPEPDAIDILLKKCELSNAEFGTIVHSAMEAALTDTDIAIPKNIVGVDSDLFDQIVQIAQEMSAAFVQSDIGSRAKNAKDLRRIEYSFLTLIESCGKKIYVSGQIDLLFVFDDTLHIVDFKTDKIEDPALHKEQLALYKRASGDLFPRYKTIKTCLYYPRTGNVADMEQYVAALDIEQIALKAASAELEAETKAAL
jgi:ATP-dependent helicase/nuclease subunit A